MNNNGKTLRLLMVTPRYFPDMGGVENHVYQVATRLSKNGVDVTVLTTDRTKQLPSQEVIDGVKIIRVSAWPPNRDYYYAPHITRVITQDHWDLVHLQSYHTLVAPIAMRAAIKASIPFIVTFHGGGHSSSIRNYVRVLQHKILAPLLKQATRLVAIAQFEIDLYSKRLGIPIEKFVLIPNGVENIQDLELNIQPTTPGLIASVGRIEKYKGHQRIVAAMPEIIGQFPQAKLWIAGSGPYEPELRQKIDRLKLHEHVSIRAIPSKDRQVMLQELSKANLVVLLSEFETHPIAILEALALGRPVLATDTSGLAELHQQGFINVIPPKSNSTMIARAVCEQLAHPQSPPTPQLPSWDDCAAALFILYRQCLVVD